MGSTHQAIIREEYSMKKISKIIMFIMSMLVVVFLLPLSAIAGYSSWIQTTQEDFDAGTKTRIKTTADGTFKLQDGNWLETTTADFNAGVIKDNINTANDEIKLSSQVKSTEAINQQNTQYSGSISLGTRDLAQSFIPNINCINTRVVLYLYKSSSVIASITASLKSDNNNSPGTTLTSVTIPASSVGTGWSWVTFDWPDVNLTANTRYWIYVTRVPATILGSYAWGLYAWALIGTDPYPNGTGWGAGEGIYSGLDFCFQVYEQHWIWGTGHFRSQEKDLGTEVAFGNFYENHLVGQTYTFKVRRYSGATWSDWVTVTNGNKINLSNGTKIQYDVTLTSSDGVTNPKVYDVEIDYIKSNGSLISQPHDCGSQITVWANFVANHNLNGQTIEYAVQTSSFIAGLSDATWYEVVSGGLITVPVNRYVQWKATLMTTDGSQTPVVDDVTIYWNPYPDEPTLTAPEDDVWTTDNTPLFEWKFNDPFPGNTQEGFRVVIDDVDTFSGINYDSGIQESTTSQWQFPFIISDGVWYWKCCTKNNYGLWGSSSTHRILKIDTTPPDIPVMNAEPALTPGLQNEVSWSAVTDVEGGCGGPIQYYVQCSSDSGFAWETAHSDGWIIGTSWNFTGLKDGVTYYYRVKAKDGLDNESEYSASVWSRQVKPLITEWYARPDPFSPNGDGTEDITTIYYTLSGECTVTIRIYDSKVTLKRTLVEGVSSSEGINHQEWDGKDGEGKIVSNGTYTYEITAEDKMGNKGMKQGTVTVKNLVTIVSTKPENNGYLVIWRDKEEEIKITFDRNMSTTTMEPRNISIMNEYGEHVSLSKIACVSSVTTITPLNLEYCTRHTVEVSTGVTDFLGIPLTEATSFSFTTLIPGSETGKVRVEHKEGIVKIDNPSETFPQGSKGWYIKLIEADSPSLSNYVEGTGRILKCYKVDDSDNPKDINQLDRPVAISVPYPSDTKDRKNLKIYFYNKDIDRWELVKGSGDTNPDDNSVTGQVSITNTEYCVRGFVAGDVIENYCNYPNPFKAGKEETTIIYDLVEDAKVTISIYDLLGQLVRRIEIPKATPGRGEQGTNEVPWDGKNERGRVVANGGYYCVVEADTETGKHIRKARKIMVIK